MLLPAMAVVHTSTNDGRKNMPAYIYASLITYPLFHNI